MPESKSAKPIVRFAPSPTGHLHIGGVRTALFNFLFAKQHGGKFILRIEDTDKERSKKEYEESIIESLKWLALTHDEAHRQSEKVNRHKEYLKKLIDSGAAYISKETPKEEGEREEVIRFKNPNKKIAFEDIVLGSVLFDTTDLGDFVIAKDFEMPLYHLAVVADDFDMGVTHVIRAQEHISNTPRQILIQEALGAPRPEYAHIPLILAPDRTKLSKRHGAVSVTEYRERGYLPEALVNYLALLGWNPGTEQEIFSKEEMIEKFSLEKIQKSPAIFDKEKLNWMNKEYLSRLPEKVVGEGIARFLPEMNFINKEGTAKIIQERIHVYGEARELADAGELDYLCNGINVKLDKGILIQPKERRKDSERATVDNSGAYEVVSMYLKHIVDVLSNISQQDFTASVIKDSLWDYATEHGRGNVLWPMRVALTGKEKSPDPFTVAQVIGKDVTLRRLEKALEILHE